jgi:hypothetical protein
MSREAEIIYGLLAEEAGYSLSRPARPATATLACGARNAQPAPATTKQNAPQARDGASAMPTRAQAPGGDLFQ